MKAILALIPAAALLASCSAPVASSGGSRYLAAFRQVQPAHPTHAQEQLAHARGYWDGDGVQGSPSIRINRAEQKAYFYKGGQLVGMSPVATGKKGHTTPPGRFKISQKSPNHRSSLYGVIKNVATGEIINDDADSRKHKPGPGEVYEGAPMDHFMRFNGGIGMHKGHLPGYAASHGCVRMPGDMARTFFENVSIGTPVTVE